jgi:GH15 family glucan-1,4-alpha-glucosidase
MAPANSDESFDLEDQIIRYLKSKTLSVRDISDYMDILYDRRNSQQTTIYDKDTGQRTADVPLNEEDTQTGMRLDKRVRVFMHNFGGPENFKKVQDILSANNIEFEKKVASFSDKFLSNISGLVINSNLSKTPAVAASQKYRNTVDVLKKEILPDFPQIKYREFKSLAENQITDTELKRIVREELAKILVEAEPASVKQTSASKAYKQSVEKAPSVQSKATLVKSINDLPGAFETWFGSLGLKDKPGVNQTSIVTKIKDTLTKMGIK